MVPWCSGLTCGPVKAEIAGSNPVGTALNVKTKINLEIYIALQVFILQTKEDIILFSNISLVLIRQYTVRYDIGLRNPTRIQLPKH